MIRDFERYHGVALRRLIVEASEPLTIMERDRWGRINSYLINNSITIHIKHCAKRLPPWQFSFTADQIKELGDMNDGLDLMWLIFICGGDGIVCLSYGEFVNLVVLGAVGGTSIRVDRSPKKCYRVSGKSQDICHVKAEGLLGILDSVARVEALEC